MTVTAIAASGRKVPLIKFRAARPEWPRRYWLADPVELPAGTKIEVVATPAIRTAVRLAHRSRIPCKSRSTSSRNSGAPDARFPPHERAVRVASGAMKHFFLIGLGAALVTALPTPGFSQALTSMASVRVGYNTRKATVNPQGELKAQIDEIDRQIADAQRLGQNAQMRRLMAKGTTLLSGREWTDALDFSTSLALRTEHVIADSTKPYPVRVEQLYAPSIELPRPLTVQARLRQRPAAAQGGGAPAPGAVVKELGTFENVPRDLRESPFALDLDVHDVADGTYQLAIDVLDAQRPLGTTTLLVNLRKGLDAIVTQIESDAKRAPENVRADILFPVDRMNNVNKGRLELRTFDPDKDFPAAQAVATASAGGKNPFATRTGDFKRHYLLDAASEILPYRMYVPTSYNGTRAYPLIIALHGLGGTEDSFFEGYDRKFPGLAEQHGYIVAAPLGYRVDGGYGWGIGNPPADATTRRLQDLSEHPA